jgi:hypothetical protein
MRDRAVYEGEVFQPKKQRLKRKSDVPSEGESVIKYRE